MQGPRFHVQESDFLAVLANQVADKGKRIQRIAITVVSLSVLPSAANGPCVEWLGVEHLAVEREGVERWSVLY